MAPRSTRATSRAAAAAPGSSPARSTRSQSVDQEAMESNSRNTRRNARARSEESNEGTKRRKANPRRAPAVQELPTVTESPRRQNSQHGLESPGVLSNISGITVRNSASANELADMDSEQMTDHLPDLWKESDQILDLLVPRADAVARVERVRDSLGNPTSRIRRNFDRYRESFEKVKEVYGMEPYLNVPLMTRGILGVKRLSEVGDGHWRPDDIFYKANLTTAIQDIMIRYAEVDTEIDSQHQVFGLQPEEMDRQFPEPFFSLIQGATEAPSTGSTLLLKESFELGLELRTQFAVQSLSNLSENPNFDHSAVILQCFYEQDNPSQLRAWNVKGLQFENLNKIRRNAITERIKVIREYCEGRSDEVNLETLQARFPVSQVVQKFLLWARQRKDEIDSRLNSMGLPQPGAQGIQAAIDVELRRRKGDNDQEFIGAGYVDMAYVPPSDAVDSSSINPAGSQSSPEARKGNASSSPHFNSPLLLQHLKSRREAHQAANGAGVNLDTFAAQEDDLLASDYRIKQIPSTAPARTSSLRNVKSVNDPAEPDYPLLEVPQDTKSIAGNGDLDLDQPDVNFGPQEEDEPEANIRSTTTRVPSPNERREFRAFHEQQEKESNKENDPSLSLQTLPRPSVLSKKRSIFDSQPDAERIEFESQAGPSMRQQPPPRQQDRDLSPVSEDEGFEQDTRPPKSSLSNRRNRAAAAGKPSPRKKARIADPPATSTQRTVKRQASTPTDSQSPSGSRMRAMPIEEGLPSRSQSYLEANRQAKEKTLQQVTARPTQRRRPWSPEEIEHLQALIEENGTSWSHIKDIDNKGGKVLEDRDQVALKDKARNMKFDILKAGAPLPANFEYVSLKSTQIETLRSFGVVIEAED